MPIASVIIKEVYFLSQRFRYVFMIQPCLFYSASMCADLQYALINGVDYCSYVHFEILKANQ